ncbi:putative C-5 sterol desaturase [Leishmania mexicana MHOM/GT/2001/U1103]|uniref:C-5 sterol desaturase n=1 Tax=Leishmania mexicana (strain MHOM/GT/2001/U1103) TaxID=929439 RepID=E9B1L0_LEIMU|nr:putative C-5 sterol desaturase [Leishmania mexicana MHOM/GT/2001/U1103]CBZ29116.1 putative C-5 sterol desaturase [Leishmania mexicana MHOM/GT/2001/U1103]
MEPLYTKMASFDMEALLPAQKYGIKVAFLGIIFVGFGVYNSVVIPAISAVVKGRIPERVKPLEKLSVKDKLYIGFAKAVTAVFVYHTYQFIRNTEVSRMSPNFLDCPAVVRSVMWLPVHLPALFIIYDFFYTLFHWALHWPPIYALIHKHHHRQMSPFRGNTDAINDNPIEYVSGEYLHLLALYLLTRMTPAGQVHALTAIIFIFLGGTLASLNHTRVDLHIPYIFNVKAHDYHHRQPRVNFGQYIMFWDWVFGTFQAEGLPSEESAKSLKKAV